MKKLIKLSLMLAVAALAFAGCSSTKQASSDASEETLLGEAFVNGLSGTCLKKLAKDADAASIAVNPQILTLNGNTVSADITVNIPGKRFQKKAILKITPVLVYEGGEAAAPAKYLQGKKVVDNYQVVSKDADGKYTQHVEFPYTPAMDKCVLQLRAEVKCKNDNDFRLVNLHTGEYVSNAALAKECGLTIAYGLNTLQKEVKFADLMAPMANNYKKVITEVTGKADLLYAINSSNLTKKAEKKADLNAFKANVDELSQNDRATQNIAVKGYASPDGPEKFNDKLSASRSESAKKAVAKLLKDSGLDVDAAAYGEDWDGFKELVEKSDIKDKNLILQVLNLYSSSSEREEQIKNMASVFNELKTEVLPQLRRAQVINTTDFQGKTDAEIMECIRKGQELTVEEYLYAAESLAKSDAERASILATAAGKYNDARVYNNLGIAQAKCGDQKAALASVEKAAQLGATPEINRNLVLSNLANGRTEEAKKYARGADAQTQGALAVAEGNYSAATKQLSGYNAAVAQVLNNDLTGAKQSLARETSADADYLRAVIAAKENDLKSAGAQLKSAVAKDPSLAQKAANDVNLKALFGSGFSL